MELWWKSRRLQHQVGNKWEDIWRVNVSVCARKGSILNILCLLALVNRFTDSFLTSSHRIAKTIQHYCGVTDQVQLHFLFNSMNSPTIISFLETVVKTIEWMLGRQTLTSDALSHTPTEERAQCLSRKQDFLNGMYCLVVPTAIFNLKRASCKPPTFLPPPWEEHKVVFSLLWTESLILPPHFLFSLKVFGFIHGCLCKHPYHTPLSPWASEALF